LTWTLQQLVEGLRKADPAAVRLLVERFEGSGRRLAAALLHDEHAAEDAVQEAMIEAVRRIAALREPAAFPGWFRQIVRTQAGRIARRRSERTLKRLPETSSCPPPETQLEEEELRLQIRRALAELPPSGRQAAELFYLDGFSLSEVADVLGVPLGTVKRRLHDARQRLREILCP
jgi:RNA polymerase sigma factor (sigma-70 family)